MVEIIVNEITPNAELIKTSVQDFLSQTAALAYITKLNPSQIESIIFKNSMYEVDWRKDNRLH
jgi:hypothetical protein